MENKKRKTKTVKIEVQEEESEKKSSEIELKHIEKLLESRIYSAYSKGREVCGNALIYLTELDHCVTG